MKKNAFLKNFKRIWQYFKSSKKYLIAYGVVSIVEAGLSILFPLLTAQIVLKMTDGLMKQLLFTAVGLLVVEIVISSFSRFKAYFYNRIYLGTMVRLQKDTAEETLKIKVDEIDKNTSGMFIERINNDTGEIAIVLMEYTYYLSYVLGNSGVLLSILFLNKYLFLYCCLVSAISFFVNKVRIDKQYSIFKELKKIREKKTGLTSEIIRGMRDIKVLNARENALDQTVDRINETAEEELRMIRVRSNYGYLHNIFNALSSFFFLVLGIYLFNHSLLTVPVFIIVYNYLGKVKSLFNNVVTIVELNKRVTVATERVFDIIDDEKYDKEKFGSKNVGKINGNIEFKNVTFGYEEGKNVLNKMSFKIKENQKVAFVGKSGTGKTTIFSLITKLYDVKDGNIYFDGHDINELDEASIRDNMSLITQNPYIFNFSIKDNLLLAKKDATDEEIVEACKIACIHDYIETLPDKYDTLLGENGVVLSGGQKQRLAIARAMLMKTEIILFDEATSALDNETQEEINKAIQNLKGEYTILIVAHRLSTVIDCDKIFVVDEGKIVAEGTHKELIKNCKFYKKLYDAEI